MGGVGDVPFLIGLFARLARTSDAREPERGVVRVGPGMVEPVADHHHLAAAIASDRHVANSVARLRDVVHDVVFVGRGLSLRIRKG